MAATIEFGTNAYPSFGIQATIAPDGGSTLNWHFQNASITANGKEVSVADSDGDTVARVFFDPSGDVTLTADVVMTGADATGATTANAMPTLYTKYVITSTAQTALAGNWRLTAASPTFNNANVVTYSLTFRKVIA